MPPRRDLQIPPRIPNPPAPSRSSHCGGVVGFLRPYFVSAIDGLAATGTTVHSLLAVPVAVAPMIVLALWVVVANKK